MATDPSDITALLGSRICHDLISPLGAIGNGLELLMMSGTVPGPEMALISESVTNANARIRFFRIAFGAAAEGQNVALSEIRSILDDMTRGGRLRLDLRVTGDLTRRTAKLMFLALQCLETAMPFGGTVRIDVTGDGCAITAEAAKMKVDPVLWARLQGADAAEITPAQVQFALFPAELARQGRTLGLGIGADRIDMRC